MALTKYAVDFVGPQNIMGVSVSPNDIYYRLSNLKHVHYLDLAESKLIIKKVRQADDGSHFHRLFYQNYVKSELLKYEIRINKYLFRTYTSMIQMCFEDSFEDSAIFRYVKLFSLLRMEDEFVIARETAFFLMKVLREKNIVNLVLMEAVFKHVFIDRLTVCSLIAFQSFADQCVPTFKLYDKCPLSSSLSDMFHSHHVCPVLGSAFTYNKTLLDALITFNIKKKDFHHIFIPLHDILIENPVYAAFEPIVEYGMVILDENRFTSRDHLLFEIITAVSMKLARLNNAKKVCDSIRLIHRSLPYPYISVSEIVSRLICLNSNLPESVVTSTISTCQSLFPEIREEMCPRSLKDLCRCTIRDSFNGRCSVNFAVETLNLPKKVATFMKLEGDDTMGRKCVICPEECNTDC